MKYEFIPSPNFNDRKLPIDMVLYHFTANSSLKSTVNWFKRPEAQASAHLVVGRDGTAVQMVDFTKRAWHAGKASWEGVTDINSCSIGVEIVNWGMLKAKDGEFYCWPNDWGLKYTGSAPYIDENGQAWEPYTEEQIVTCVAIGKDMYSRYKVPKNRYLGHEQVAPGRKTDPGPAFPWERVLSEIFPAPPVVAFSGEEEISPLREDEMLAQMSERQGNRSDKPTTFCSWLARKLG